MPYLGEELPPIFAGTTSHFSSDNQAAGKQKVRDVGKEARDNGRQAAAAIAVGHTTKLRTRG
jgi:hypothetical protein